MDWLSLCLLAAYIPLSLILAYALLDLRRGFREDREPERPKVTPDRRSSDEA